MPAGAAPGGSCDPSHPCCGGRRPESAGLATGSARRRRRIALGPAGPEPVLDHQAREIAPVKKLDPHVGIERSQESKLSIFLRDQTLLQRRQLNEKVVI